MGLVFLKSLSPFPPMLEKKDAKEDGGDESFYFFA